MEDYIHATRLWTLTLEISVMMAQFPSKEIAQLSYDFRTLGLGYANIGGLLMNRGWVMTVTRAVRDRGADGDHDGVSYATSAEIAGELGPLRGLRGTASTCCGSFATIAGRRMGMSTGKGALTSIRSRLTMPTARTSGWCRSPCRPGTRRWPWAKSTGARNAQATVIAPTGTIGLVMDCDTTGSSRTLRW